MGLVSGIGYRILLVLTILVIVAPKRPEINRTLGLFPHQVGNKWIKSPEYCRGIYKLEVVSEITTDTATFFNVKHWESRCEDEPEKVYTRWYAEDSDGIIYVVAGEFEFESILVDYSMNIGDRFIRMGLMDYVVDKTPTTIVTEYDNWEEYKPNSVTWEFGLGMNPFSWDTIKVNGHVYHF